MKYLLIGIQGVYNYGCEAIVRGTERILRAADPCAEIVYSTPAIEDDKKRLRGCDIRFTGRTLYPRHSWQRIAFKLADLLSWDIPIGIDDCRPYLKEQFDFVLSVGGDMYTLNARQRPPLQMMALGNFFLKRRIPLVLWGASVGPFSQQKQVEKQIMRHLQKMSALTIREPETIRYLAACGVSDNIVLCGDPAFCVAPEISKQEDSFFADGGIRIALNFSPLSASFSTKNPESIRKEQRQWMMRQMDNARVAFTLVPHVVPPQGNQGDDDYIYLKTLRDSLPENYRERVALLPRDLGFVATKKELIKHDLCIAARMHCAINAVSAQLPTIFLSYSKKSIGISEMVYGTPEYAIPLENIDKIAIDRKNIRSLYRLLADRIPGVRQKAMDAGKLFAGSTAEGKQ